MTLMRGMRTTGLVAAALSASMLFTGCAGSGGSGGTEAAGDSGSGQSSQKPMQSGRDSNMQSGGDTSSGQMDPMSDLVGAGCKAYAKQVPSGAGSVQGMSTDPVAVAAGNNPLLKTLTQAVSGKLNPKVDLVDTLDGGRYTVFAPVDQAFGKLPKSMVQKLSRPKNADLLTSALTYHVVQGRLTPDEVTGKHASVQGEPVKVTGSGNNLKVNGAHVICGGVQTANATVYLIDEVLTPPSMM